MSIDAMKQALDYIKATNKSSSFWLVPASELNKTVTALRLAIEQAEKQEPVAWAGLEKNDMPDGENSMYDHPFFIEGMVWANNKLLEKNAAPQPLGGGE
jgi:hypothetical protein